MKLNTKILAGSLATLMLATSCGVSNSLPGQRGLNFRGSQNGRLVAQSAGKKAGIKINVGQLRKYKNKQKKAQVEAKSVRSLRAKKARFRRMSGDKGGVQKFSPEAPFRYQAIEWHLRKTNTVGAWKHTPGIPEVKVAVIDTGVDYEHPALKGRVIKGTDFASSTGGTDNDPMDEGSHGTHVAGIIAANDGNLKGIAPGASIIAIKVFSPDGFAQGEYALPKAILEAVDKGASIINMSLGAATLYDCDKYSAYSRALNSAIDEAYSKGVSVVTAAGNETHGYGNSRCSVQQNLNQIPVIATNEMDRISTFSSYTNLDHPKAISAPGVNIFSTIPTHVSCDEISCDLPYDYMDGTSMASPVVAGTLALIRSGIYQDYVRVAENQLNEGRLRGGRVLSYREFFHDLQRGGQWQMELALTPHQLSERILFAHTNQSGRQNPEGLDYQGSRHPIFGFGRVDIGAATRAASNVFTAAGF